MSWYFRLAILISIAVTHGIQSRGALSGEKVQVSRNHSFRVVGASIDFKLTDKFSIRSVRERLEGTGLTARFFLEETEGEPLSVIAVFDSTGEIFSIFGDPKTEVVTELYSESSALTDYKGAKVGDKLRSAVGDEAVCDYGFNIICSPVDDGQLLYYIDFDCPRLTQLNENRFRTSDCEKILAISIVGAVAKNSGDGDPSFEQ